MNTKNLLTISAIAIFLVFFSLGFISAVTVEQVDADKIMPGETGHITITVKNTLSEDIEDVSLILNLDKTSFTTIGSSEDSEEEIKENREESFSFIIKAPNDLKPGDYNIPYTIKYTNTGDNEEYEKQGSFGIAVSGETKLLYSIGTEKNVVGEQGKISLKIINAGLGDVKFVSITTSSQGFEFLSSNIDYIDKIESGDDETASFDVLFISENAKLTVVLKYKDFENKDITESIELPVKVYSREKGLKLGIISKSKIPFYAGVVIAVIIIWIIYRQIRKRNRRKDKERRENERVGG